MSLVRRFSIMGAAVALTIGSVTLQAQGQLPSLGSDRILTDTAFNPAISVILDGLYYDDSRQGEGLDGIAGFDGHGGDDSHDHEHGGVVRGFNLRETEITFSGTVDPYFDALATLALGSDGVEVEEAYLLTRALPGGLQLKGGRFLSGIGYINEQHPHVWQFVDRPLPYALLLGDHGLQENGLQLTWVPATTTYARFGVELLQGENEALLGEAPRGHSGPALATLFAKFAPNFGYSHGFQFGLFGGEGDIDADTEHTSGRVESWDGRIRFVGTDMVYKYASGRQYGIGDFAVQAEYLMRERRYDYREVQPDLTVTADGRITSRQDGLYLQTVYGFAPRWQAGLRYEGVGFSNRVAGVSEEATHRGSLVLTYLPTEFSRLRLQLSRARLAADDHEDDSHGHESVNQVFLQYQMSLGAHGAHRF